GRERRQRTCRRGCCIVAAGVVCRWSNSWYLLRYIANCPVRGRKLGLRAGPGMIQLSSMTYDRCWVAAPGSNAAGQPPSRRLLVLQTDMRRYGNQRVESDDPKTLSLNYPIPIATVQH